jgi:hypothetical protein
MAIGNAIGKQSAPQQQLIVQQPAPGYYGGPSRYYTPSPTVVKETTIKKNPFTGTITKKTVIRKR